jgi:hypothetical protein
VSVFLKIEDYLNSRPKLLFFKQDSSCSFILKQTNLIISLDPFKSRRQLTLNSLLPRLSRESSIAVFKFTLREYSTTSIARTTVVSDDRATETTSMKNFYE